MHIRHMQWIAEVDEFAARRGDVRVRIIVSQMISATDKGGLKHGPPIYATAEGLKLERLDTRHFRLVATGEVFERIG